jgi:phage-related protein
LPTISSLVGEVRIVGASTAQSQLQGVNKATEETKGGFKGMLGGAMSFAGAIGIANLASDAFGFLKDQVGKIFTESLSAAAGMAQTVSVLHSTHDASGMTAQAVADLATQMSHLTLFSDDTVQAAENMLLTFTNIGKNVFPQATKTVLDMSQALGQDTKSSAIQLGKALNDPIKGVTALQRVGVTFTQAQKDLIKSLVDSGNVAGAQKVILKELQTEFGGSAAAAGRTFPGQLKILGQSLDDIRQSIGDALMPVMKQLTSWVSANLVPAFSRFSAWFTSTGLPALMQFGSFIRANAIPILAGLSVVIGTLLVGAVWSFTAALLANPIVLIIAGIALAVGLLTAGFMALYNNNAGFRSFIDGVVGGFKAAAGFINANFLPAMKMIGDWIKAYVWPVLQQLGAFIASVFVPVWAQLVDLWNSELLPIFKQLQPALQQLTPLFQLLGIIVGGVVVVALGVLIGVISGVAKGLGYFIEGLARVISGVIQMFTGITQVVSGVVQFIDDLIHGRFNKLSSDLGLIWQGIINIFSGAWKVISGIFQAAWGLISGIVGGFVQGIVGFFTGLYHRLVGGSIVPDMINGIVTWFQQLPGRAGAAIVNMVTSVLTKLGGLAAQGLTWAGNFVSGLFNSLNNLASRAGTAMQNATTKILDVLGGMISDAAQAGANIVTAIANGILNTIESAIGNAMGQVGQFISDHLPHSPAKIGPLVTLAQAGANIPGEIAKGMTAGIPKLQSSLNMMLTPVLPSGGLTMPFGGSLAPSAGASPTIVINVQPNDISLDGVRLSRGLLPYITDALVYNVSGGFGR